MKITIRRFVIIFAFCFLSGSLGQTQALAATSIKKLLDKARPGQTVRIPSGTFIEDLVVPPGVSLIGAGTRKTIIVGNIELSGTAQNPVSLSRVTVINPGGRASRAVACKSGRVSIYNTYLIS